MSAVIDAARHRCPSEEIANLTEVLTGSGRRRRLSPVNADVSSTGGPGSLSTILGPLALAASGLDAPKFTVPGRPAGSIDTLGSLPGYGVSLDSQSFERVLARCGFAQSLPTADFAPLDATLFEFRQRHRAQAVAPLVIASLLSKKLAAGVGVVGIDVRVGADGNFGMTAQEAQDNAAVLVETARTLGINAVCVLSDGVRVPQPFLGRGEALFALATCAGMIDWPSWLPTDVREWLAGHHATWSAVADSLISQQARPAGPRDLSALIRANVTEQGASVAALEGRLAWWSGASRHTHRAAADGWASYDVQALRSLIVARQSSSPPGAHAAFSDPGGLILLRPVGSLVTLGEPLALSRGLGDVLGEVERALCPESAPLEANRWDGMRIGLN
jgi:pyrimidine-nucleoside phosphorylase